MSKVLKEYNTNSQKGDSIVDQIDYIQGSLKKLQDNQEPANALTQVVKNILDELDGRKEQEIVDFLNKLRNDRLNKAQDKFSKVTFDLSQLEKRLREVESENNGFMGQLSKANTNPQNRDKTKLIEQLLRESEGSKRDLKKISTEAGKFKGFHFGLNLYILDDINKGLNCYDLSRINLKDLHNLLRDLDTYEVSVTKKLGEIDVIDAEIEERKKRWKDYLTQTEAKDKVMKELLSLIPLLREKFDRLVKSYNFCNNSLSGFFLVNQKIQENEYYETNETPCLNREQIKLQLGDLNTKKEEYEPKVEHFESYDNQKLKNTDQAEIEQLIDQATSLIKHLDSDNHSLEEINKYLREERKDFKNGDIYNNQRRIDRQIAVADEKLQQFVHEFESMKESLANTEVIDAKINHRLREIEANIVNAGNTLEKARQSFEETCKEIDREDMNNAKLATIAGIISKLGKISNDLHDLAKIFEDTDNIFKELQSELVDLYYSKKLADMLGVVKMLLERLKRLSDLIDKLIELAKEFEGYTSDQEEEEFVNDLETELAEVKQHHKQTDDELHQLEKQITELQHQLSESPPKIDEEKAEKIDVSISDLSKMIENIERLVDTKIQRFADMDPYKKFRKREKELNKLSNFLSDREEALAELKGECTEDLHSDQSGDDLKEAARETLEDIESLEDNIDNLKQRIALLGNEIDGFLEKSAKTEMTIEEIFDMLYANVEIKKKIKQLLAGIDDFGKALSEFKRRYLVKKAESPPMKTYKATKGDQVDEMLGDWINAHGCEIEIKRLGGGFYMFGEKKIYAKIINGKLIIRVGGGYMNIDEFMKHYGAMELARQQRIYEMEYESLNYDELMSNDDELSNPPDRNSVIGIAEAKKGLRGSFGGSFIGSKKPGSPMRGSPKGSKAGGLRPGSPGSFGKSKLGGSPRAGNNSNLRTPGNRKGGTFVKRQMPSAAKIEESLRKMEEDAKEGKLKEGYNNLAFKK